MSAVACLRVVLDLDTVSSRDRALGPIVRKLASAYLETRWTWPREFEPLTNYAFLLKDPRADELNVRELVKLSEELQLKFFGQSNAGKVSLLLLEGSEIAARDFAGLEGEALARARSDPSCLPAGSRLAQIFTEDLVTQMTSTAASVGAPEAPAPPPRTPAQLFGIYFRMRSVFIGDVVSHVDEHSRDRPMVVDGAEHLPKNPEAFDAGCIEVALDLLKDEGLKSILYVPLSYDSLVRPSQREAVAARISRLPEARRSQVAAIIYNVPRAPAFGVVTQIRTMLLSVFNTVDLRIEDPAFEIDKLPPQAVAGVSFALPTGDRRTRMTALRRFTEQRAAYKQRRIWASVTNIRDHAELEACEALGIPFVTGPAICAPQARPLGGRVVAPESLPVR